MRIDGTIHGNARTYLTHIFGVGLEDDRYLVERFVSTFEGGIEPYARKGGRKEARKVMSLRAVQRLRPERDEIIIATGVEQGGGLQIWGSRATQLFVSGRHR